MNEIEKENERSLDKHVSGNSRMMESVHFRKFKTDFFFANKVLGCYNEESILA